jgi:hypothetical protein
MNDSISIAELDAIIDRVMDVCGVDPMSVGIEYRRGNDRADTSASWTVQVDVKRKRSSSRLTVAGYASTPSKAAVEAITTVRHHVMSGNYTTPRGMKPDETGDDAQRLAARQRVEFIATCVEMGMDQTEAAMKYDAMLAKRAAR